MSPRLATSFRSFLIGSSLRGQLTALDQTIHQAWSSHIHHWWAVVGWLYLSTYMYVSCIYVPACPSPSSSFEWWHSGWSVVWSLSELWSMINRWFLIHPGSTLKVFVSKATATIDYLCSSVSESSEDDHQSLHLACGWFSPEGIRNRMRIRRIWFFLRLVDCFENTTEIEDDNRWVWVSSRLELKRGETVRLSTAAKMSKVGRKDITWSLGRRSRGLSAWGCSTYIYMYICILGSTVFGHWSRISSGKPSWVSSCQSWWSSKHLNKWVWRVLMKLRWTEIWANYTSFVTIELIAN